MATEAASFHVSPLPGAKGLAWLPGSGVKSAPGMTTATTTEGSGRGKAGQAGLSTAEERAAARAPEMELIRQAQAGSRGAFDALVRQYEHLSLIHI